MTLLKLLFVILILIPIAFIMMFIIDNLAKEASDDTIDINEAHEKKRREEKKKKRKEMIQSAKNTARNTAKTAQQTAQKTAQKTAKKTVRKKKRRSSQGRPQRQATERPAAQRPAGRPYTGDDAPNMIPVQDNSKAYIEEYKKRREELERRSRYSDNPERPVYPARKPSLKGFDTLYGKRKK